MTTAKTTTAKRNANPPQAIAISTPVQRTQELQNHINVQQRLHSPPNFVAVSSAVVWNSLPLTFDCVIIFLSTILVNKDELETCGYARTSG